MAIYSTRRAVAEEGIDLPAGLLDDLFANHPSAGPSLLRLVKGVYADAVPWEVVGDSVEMAVHAALLHTSPSGKVLYFGGDYHADYSYVHDTGSNTVSIPTTSTSAPPDTPLFGLLGSDLFCCGHAFLHTGELLVAGGQRPSPSGDESDEHQHGGMRGGGERTCFRFFPEIERWDDAALLNLDPDGNPRSGGRWYPTLTTLGTGVVLALGGHPDVRETFPEPSRRHSNNTPETYHPIDDEWSLVGGDTTEENGVGAYDYHRTHLLPDGGIFFASNTREANRIYDPDSGLFRDDPVVELPPDTNYRSPAQVITDPDTGEVVDILRATALFTSVLLPLIHEEDYVPRVLVAGEANSYICDFGTEPLRWTRTNPRDWEGTPPRRVWCTGVMLANGEVFITGGAADSSSVEAAQGSLVLEGEVCRAISDWSIDLPGDRFFDFERVSWRTVASAAVGRRYHGTALLLPDGTVWTGGSNGTLDFDEDTGVARQAETRIEIYRPEYCAFMDRPEIDSAPSGLSPGESFEIGFGSAFGILRTALIRNGSATHGFNGDQRYVSMDFDDLGGGRMRLTAPPNFDVAPPGYYMLWIIDGRGAPCMRAPFVRFA